MDFHSIGEQAAEYDNLQNGVVPGRVLQMDADILAYGCSNLGKPLGYAKESVNRAIENNRRLARAEKIKLHLTVGLKGGREEVAFTKKYQAKRRTDPKMTERVTQLRMYMTEICTDTTTAVVNYLQEADDSMAQYQVRQNQENGESVIMSGDKDLWMVPGRHIDPATGTFYLVQGYGKTRFRDVGNTKKKLIGRGTSWFWHQMLHGDKADNIPGLEQMPGEFAEKYSPKKKPDPKRKPLRVGETLAVKTLHGVTTDREAFRRVYELYKAHYRASGVEHFLEQAFLLWIRRTPKVLDVLDFLNSKEVSGMNFYPTPRMRRALLQFKENALRSQTV